MKLVPYKHPSLGWFFDWGFMYMVDGGLHIVRNGFACKWNSKQPLRLKPKKIPGRVWSDGDVEDDMYIWLKFNISFVGGWGIGLTYR